VSRQPDSKSLMAGIFLTIRQTNQNAGDVVARQLLPESSRQVD